MLNISSEEAETILFALVLRSKQKNLHYTQKQQAIDIALRLEKEFIAQFKWDSRIERIPRMSYPIKHVTIKCYDFPPS
jgi:hypothetical protein